MSQTNEQGMSAAQAAFAEYFVKNYPGPHTVISDPNWHAPKLFRAAMRAMNDAGLLAEAQPLLPSAADEPVAWDEGSPCVEPRPVGMVYPPKPAPRASGYLPDGSGVEWNAYDTAQMESYARAAYADGFAAAVRPASARPSAGVEDIAEIVRGIDASESVNPTPNPECSAQVKLVDVSDWQAIKAALSSVAPAAMLNPPLPPHLRGLAGDGVVTTARFAGEGGCYGDGCPGCSVCNSTGSDLDQDSPA